MEKEHEEDIGPCEGGKRVICDEVVADRGCAFCGFRLELLVCLE